MHPCLPSCLTCMRSSSLVSRCVNYGMHGDVGRQDVWMWPYGSPGVLTSYTASGEYCAAMLDVGSRYWPPKIYVSVCLCLSACPCAPCTRSETQDNTNDVIFYLYDYNITFLNNSIIYLFRVDLSLPYSGSVLIMQPWWQHGVCFDLQTTMCDIIYRYYRCVHEFCY